MTNKKLKAELKRTLLAAYLESWKHKILYGEPGDYKKVEGLPGKSPIQVVRAAIKKASRTQKRRSPR